MLLNFFSVDLQTLPNVYGSLKAKIFADNPQNCKISKNFPLEIFRLYGTVVI